MTIGAPPGSSAMTLSATRSVVTASTRTRIVPPRRAMRRSTAERTASTGIGRRLPKVVERSRSVAGPSS
jgi:hypothetical protein